MTNRGRTAAKLTGVAAAAALVFGVMGPASAATQNVEYRLDAGTITFPSADPITITLPEATGITGTWDDVTGDFSGTFTSAAFTSQREVTVAPGPPPIVGTVTQQTQIVAPDPVTGNIDPETGEGTLSANFTVNIVIESIDIGGTVSAIGANCTITPIPVTYTVTATGLGGESVIFTNLSLTSGFSVPAATCTVNGQPAPAAITDGLNSALALPNSSVTSSLTLVAGAVPPPPVTTTTTIPATTTTTAAPSTTTEPAAAVTATVHFTG